MIKRSKGLELIKIFFITSLNTFGLIMFLILQIMDFENVTLKYIYIYIYFDERQEYIYTINMI
jgi:hypothetical protein